MPKEAIIVGHLNREEIVRSEIAKHTDIHQAKLKNIIVPKHMAKSRHLQGRPRGAQGLDHEHRSPQDCGCHQVTATDPGHQRTTGIRFTGAIAFQGRFYRRGGGTQPGPGPDRKGTCQPARSPTTSDRPRLFRGILPVRDGRETTATAGYGKTRVRLAMQKLRTILEDYGTEQS